MEPSLSTKLSNIENIDLLDKSEYLKITNEIKKINSTKKEKQT